jgi:ubiquinone/menaquinone biosynthesis C-methylase UbiE
MINALREFHRILKPGGVIRLGPLDAVLMRPIVEQVPGLEIDESIWGNHVQILKVD